MVFGSEKFYEIRFSTGTQQEWAIVNPVLGPGEPGHESDTSRLKIGDGVKAWSQLEYFTPGSGGSGENPDHAALFDHIQSATPHPVYDDGPSLLLLYMNAKV